jgi:hypothetical protein
VKVRLHAIGFLLVTLSVSGCRANRSAKDICDTARRVQFTRPLVESHGEPDFIDKGAPPAEWWYYEGKDGVCVVPVGFSVPGDGGTISGVQFRLGAKLQKKSN